MHTGEKIRNVRLLRGLSQENVSDVLGISRVAYSDIERGKTELTDDRLKQIANALNVSPEDIDAFDSRVNYFFENCNGASANISNGTVNNHSGENRNEDVKEMQFEIEKLKLELKLCRAEKEKAEIEARYWKEKKGL